MLVKVSRLQTTLPLAVQPTDVAEDPDVVARLRTREDENGTLMQSDLNNETFSLCSISAVGLRVTYPSLTLFRTLSLRVTWNFDQAVQNNELPEAGSFNMYKEDGQPTNDYGEVAEIIINGTDRNNKVALSQTRKGATLVIFDVLLNSFSQFVIDDVEFTGSVEGGQFWANFHVRVAFGRNVGIVPDDAPCEIQIISPYPSISTDGTPPVVDNDGYLWYNEANKTLYVSDWDDDQDNNGDAVWIPVGGEGVSGDGGDVSGLEQRVTDGEAAQQQILGRVDGHDSALNDLYANQSDFLRYQIANDVTTSFRIKTGGKTLISTSGGYLGLYNLNEPSDPSHAVNLGYVDDNYLSLTNGGTISGLTIIDRPSGTAFKVKKSNVDHVKIEAGGKIFCNYNMELDDDDTTVPNKGWVKSRIAAGGGGGPTTKYDGNKYCRQGISGNTLNQGDVMFFNDELVSTTDPNEIAAIAFCPFDFDWDKCVTLESSKPIVAVDLLAVI